MTSKDQLPFILSLIEDETQEVRDNVLKGLTDYGSTLEKDLLEFSDLLDSKALKLLDPIIQENRRQWLKHNWTKWQGINNEIDQLESAVTIISKFQYGPLYKYDLSHLLDRMAQNFQNIYPYGNELDLAVYLFQELRISGDKKDYFNPLNSNLYYTIDERQGLPITLCILYMLIGSRAGFSIEGCNFPGHFLAKIIMDDELLLIDCFNGGRIIYESEILSLFKDSSDAMNQLIKQRITSKAIIKRVVGNLINAYKEMDNQPNRYLFTELLGLTIWQ